MAIDFSNIAGNIKDKEGNRPTRPTQQQQNVYQQAADTMREAGIGSLSGRVTSDDRGQRASEILEEAGFDIGTPGNMATVGVDRPTQGKIIETAGDPLKRSIVSNILRGKPPRETGIFGLDTSNLGLPTINPALGFIQGLGNTNAVLKKLSLGSELNSKDKLTLVNLVDRFGGSQVAGGPVQRLIDEYAKNNELSTSEARNLAVQFGQAYKDIENLVEDVNPSMNQFFDRMDDMSFAETAGALAKNLTGTRDAYDTIPPNYLENITDRLGTEGLQFLKVTNPQAYYRLRPNDPDLANESFVSTGDKVADRRFNAKIMEARALAADKQSRQDANMGQGIMASSPAFASPASQYGIFIGKPGPFIGNFVDTDGDGIDDRFQTGPGQPRQPFVNPKAPLPGTSGTPQPVATGITPFDVRQFYASLPQYTQQGIMNPNLAQFYQNLGLFPGMNV